MAETTVSTVGPPPDDAPRERPAAELPAAELPRSESFRPDIQGLRAVAILLVLLFHAGVSVMSGGYVGVDVFFVISGFLITGHIWKELRERGRIDFGRFYARRARRILPASFAVLGLTVIATLIWVAPLRVGRDLAYAVATALYVPNVLLAQQGASYLSDPAPPATQHYWSLGVEEQFYLLWPLGMVVAFWLVRRSRRGFIVLMGAVVVGSLALAVVLTQVNQPYAFFLLPSRAWELGAGGVLALIVASGRLRAPRLLAAVIGWAGVALILYAAFTFSETTPFPGWHATIPVGGAVLVILAGSLAKGGWSAPWGMLSTRPMVWIGAISYSLYLVHWPLLVIPQAAVGLQNPLPLVVTLALGALAVPLGWLSFRYIETPFRTMPRFTRAPNRRTFLAVAAASAAVVLVAGAGYVANNARPLATSEEAVAVAVATNPVGATVVPANLTPSLTGAATDLPEIEFNGCSRGYGDTTSEGCTVGTADDAPTVALFGDSHAAQWYPAFEALAENGDITLTTYAKAQCPIADVSVARVPECGEWRDAVIERLAADPPDVIVIGNYAARYMDEDNIEVGEWIIAEADVIATLPEESTVLVLTDTPSSNESIPICLSANLSDAAACNPALPGDEAGLVASAEAQAADGVIDLNAYLCTAEGCPAIIGNWLVYRDSNHLSATYATALAAPLWEQLRSHL